MRHRASASPWVVLPCVLCGFRGSLAAVSVSVCGETTARFSRALFLASRAFSSTAAERLAQLGAGK